MSRCALQSWIARATSSLPVPVSPVIRTVLRDCATSLRARDDVLHRPAAAEDAVVVELLVALGDEIVVLGAQPLRVRRPARRRRGTRRCRRASAGSRARRASSPRWRFRPMACAVIIRMAGRSVDGIERRRPARITSRPLSSGIRLSTTSTSNGRSPSQRSASRGLPVADDVVALRPRARCPGPDGSWARRRRAETTLESRMPPACRRGPPATRWSTVVPSPGGLIDDNRAAEAFDDVAWRWPGPGPIPSRAS